MQTELDRKGWTEVRDDIKGNAEAAKVRIENMLRHVF